MSELVQRSPANVAWFQLAKMRLTNFRRFLQGFDDLATPGRQIRIPFIREFNSPQPALANFNRI